jgi:putative Mg2+ transporter-C (MgtC) family protein
MLSYKEIIIRLCLSALLGSIIGLERERLDWAAGLRTHMLVCVGATLFMIVSAFGFVEALRHQSIVLDPSRIAAQVVTGVGFLGAGTIIFRREVIRGLTTAASLWAVAAIGLSVGGGLYNAAITTTLLVVIILFGLKPLEMRLFKHRRPQVVTLVVNRQEINLHEIETAVEGAGLRLRQILIQPGDSPEQEQFQIMLDRMQRGRLLDLFESLRSNSAIIEISDGKQ